MTTMLQKFNKTNLNYFWNGIISNKKIIVITSILQILGFPIMALTLVLAAASDYNFEDNAGTFFIVIAVCCVIAATLCGLIIAVNNFNYLYKKSRVDMVFSLPIKAKNRFICDFFSGLLVYVIPYIAAALITLAIVLISGGFMTEIRDMLKDGLLEFGLKGMVMLLLVMVMIYTLAVLVMQCCGSFFESLMNIFLINAIIPGMILVISVMLLYRSYGVNFFCSSLPILCCTSPAGGVTEFFALMLEDIDRVPNTLSFVKWLIMYIIVTAIFFAAALFLHTKRKAESVSKPYAFKLLYYVSLTSIISAICLIARVETSLIFPVIVCSAIVYMIFEVITNRGFKKFYKSAIKFAVTMFSILIVGLVSSATKGFGTEGRVPSVNSVKSIDVNYNGFFWAVKDTYSYDDTVVNITEKNAIECIINAQKSALETYRNDENKDYYFGEHYYYRQYEDSEIKYPKYEFNITYNMKNGSHIHREYLLTQEQVLSLTALDRTEAVGKVVKDKLLENITTFNSTLVNEKEKIQTIYIISVRSASRNSTVSNQVVTKEEALEFAEAYKQDYMEMSAEEMFKGENACYLSSSSMGYLSDLPVKKSFKRTLDLLKKYSIDMPPYYNGASGATADLYPPEGYASSHNSGFTSSYGGYFADQNLKCSIGTNEYDELIKYARTDYIDENKCYVMISDGERFIIPYEYSDIAKKIYEGAYTHDDSITDDYLQFANDVSENGDNEMIVKKYGLPDTASTYNQLEFLRSIPFYQYENYSTFDSYFEDNYYELNYADYNYITEKALWDLWQVFKRFYGFNSLEEYKQSAGVQDDISDEELEENWDIYYRSFSELCKSSN